MRSEGQTWPHPLAVFATCIAATVWNVWYVEDWAVRCLNLRDRVP